MTWANRDDDRPGLEPERVIHTCDECCADIEDGDVYHTPFGRFCSEDCACDYEQDFSEHMRRQGWMSVTPDMLSKEQGE